MILSVPATTGAYSVLTLDPYGNVFDAGLPSQSPGASLPATTYALTGPNYAGPVPQGNGSKTAAYYQTFHDRQGRALDGSRRNSYTLTFAKSELPAASRFWSVTAYTPESVELIANPEHKYVVASYTPGLKYNADGSLTIHLAPEQPDGVPTANWLPIPRRNFNVMLRVYGPEGSVANNTYVPPAVDRARQ